MDWFPDDCAAPAGAALGGPASAGSEPPGVRAGAGSSTGQSLVLTLGGVSGLRGASAAGESWLPDPGAADAAGA
ncbi:MAG: hypothetical protein ACLGH7_09800, partial [Actinomycetes bacterium]